MLSLLSLVACMSGPNTDGLPDNRLLIQLPTSSSSGKSLSKAEEKNWSTYYLLTAQVTDQVNGMVGFVLGLTTGIVSTQRPTTYDEDNGFAEWGPYADTLDPVETVLWVQHNDDNSYSWGYDQWPKEDETARVTVVTGEVDAGATKESSTGRFTIDFTTIHQMDPTSAIQQGSFSSEYSLSPTLSSNTVTVADYTLTSFDGVYAYAQGDAGDGTMDLKVAYDAYPGSADELHTVTSAWTPEGAGRADATLSGGDLGSQSGAASECWSTSFERVYYTEDWSSLVEGDPTLCAL
ncbi:MAG TPA: hypothetical protein PKY30_16660 [Myxococcota bacterium]|nr:hypothetical protein [Myxococcota bacterium]HNH48675.1 hypothetical protein [Myxococcota bacterium]